MVIDKVKYKFDRPIMTIPEEAEIRVFEPDYYLPKPKVFRKGLPQGLSISPILATAVLDSFPHIEGLVMYADDGLIIRKNSDKDQEIKN